MDTSTIIAILLTLATLFAIANHLTLRLPMTIGVLVFSLTISIAVMALNPFIPGYDLQALPRSILGAIDLPRSLLNGVLSLLLFAGAMQVDLTFLRARLASVAALAIGGTVLAVAALASTAWVVFPFLGEQPPFAWCIILGAILAPTDPVSVVGMLRRLGLPGSLQAMFAGESLLNDGVGVVIFGLALEFVSGHAQAITGSQILLSFLHEAVGGALLGALTGWFTPFILRLARDPHIDLLASLALATGTFSAANALGMSGPIAVVIAGMMLGTDRAKHVLDEHSRAELDAGWTLIDEILNVLLFVLIGFEVMEITPRVASLVMIAAMIPLALFARWVSVLLATLPAHIMNWDKGRTVGILTWGGLRGGISVALAIGLPPGELRNLLLPICYGVVVFTIIVQGLTMEKLARRLYPSG